MTDKERETQWISFSLGDETFACDIQKIQEIIPYQEPIPVPGAPQEVEGVLNVRGKIIPVISGQQVACADTDSTIKDKEKSNIIILDSKSGQLGLTIDTVNEIIHIDSQTIQYEESENSCITGSALYKENLIILLDIDPMNFQNYSYA